jgi:TatD DNase family protein
VAIDKAMAQTSPIIQFVDTHCHIQSAGIDDGERLTHAIWAKNPKLSGAAIIAAAKQAGVMSCICVGCDLNDSKLAIHFAAQHEHCWASIGLHPHEAQQYNNDQIKRDAFRALVGDKKVVAIGECGLDYFYEHSPKADQIAVLRFQFELAREYDLPMIFHVREALFDFWPIFDEYNDPKHPIRGVLHSFTDSMENLHKALHRGLYIGVNGIVTFVKDPAQRAVYRSIPLSNLLLETDAPFLTPVPYRGKINESKYIRIIAEFIAELHGVSLELLAEASTVNARSLFGLSK